jgi:sialate O-acetylesterase
MVLQGRVKLPVWGSASPGEAVTVSIGTRTAKAVAGADGAWMLKLDPLEPGGPFELTVAGKNTLRLKNVLVGEVWVCSGQSNMAWQVRQSLNADQEIAAANFPMIRLFQVERTGAPTPQKDVNASWVVCAPDSVAAFSAVAYFFGRDLYSELKVPIGLIQSDFGGTPAESWTPWKTLESDPDFADVLARWQRSVGLPAGVTKRYEDALADWKQAVANAKAEGKPVPSQPEAPTTDPALDRDPRRPAGLYNAMIAPLHPFAIRGVIWYQGEGNVDAAKTYRKLLPAMIRSWRTAWGQGEVSPSQPVGMLPSPEETKPAIALAKAGDFHFLIVQLANFMAARPDPSESAWAELREAQLMTALNVPNCAIASASDLGEADNVHPRNKQEVGRRLALAAFATVYGKKDLVYSGPLYSSVKVNGNEIQVAFKHVAGGLVAKGGGPLKGFALAGEDKVFVWADAKIQGDSVVVSSDRVQKPVAVRYAWADNPVANLCNKEGLPALPFRSDDWDRK